MRMTYCVEADALDVELLPGAKSERTVRLSRDVLVDFDRRGRLIGVEVLNASHHYGRTALEQLPTGVEYITLAEGAAEEKVSRVELRAALRKGELKGVQRGRGWLIARHELWNYLENRGTEPPMPRHGH
jgi:uncharacterized protein YuzE